MDKVEGNMIELNPIGFIKNTRKEIRDDHWGDIESEIVLTKQFSPEALAGIEEFSHAEILFFFHQVPPEKIQIGSRHPRNNSGWPKVGIFAQRGKNRPNRIGSTIVRVIDCKGTHLRVKGLDAIDGTPVLDIKPIMAEFLPKEKIVQPTWSHEVMIDYWDTTPED